MLEEPAAAVAALPRQEVAEGSPLSQVDELAACGEDFDVVRLEGLLDKAFAQADLAEVVDEWLMPSLVRLGVAWQRGSVSVAGEHFVSAAVLRRLSLAFHQLPHPAADSPSAVVGLAKGSRHELGVMAFSVVLRSRGVAVTYLGGDLPVESWVDTVRAVSPDAVVLSAPTVEDLPAVREAVQAISASATVLLGGAHQDRVEGAEALGHRPGAAAAAALAGAPDDRRLTPARPTSRPIAPGCRPRGASSAAR